MSGGKIALIVVVAVVVLGGFWLAGGYNDLVKLNENVNQSQANVEVQYQRRFDLIPGLVNTVQGSADFEKSVVDSVTAARARYGSAAAGSPEKLAALNQLETSLSRLLVVVENYPQIKSSEAFLKLQDQLEGTENRIAVSRNTYNGVTNDYNKAVRSFPKNIIAGVFNFDPRELFKATEAAQTAPEVEFDFK